MNTNNLLHLLRSYLRRRRSHSPYTPSFSLRFLSQFCYFPCSSIRNRVKPIRTHGNNSSKKNANKALRVLSLISPKSGSRVASGSRHAHLRLIEDFLQTHPEQLLATEPPRADAEFSSSGTDFEGTTADSFERVLDLSPLFETKDPVSLLLGLHREGLMWLGDVGVFVVSRSLGACGSERDFCCGVQLHCLSIRYGFLQNVYVGSSLVSLYGKCGELGSACKVFEEMPERNVVSWSALISGFAQDWQVDLCLELYSQMRSSGFEPNDYTLTALLSACMGSGSLRMGRIIHCQTILLGFNSDVTVSNAIISMYCKCGDVPDAFSVFEAMHNKDIVSWNSIIAGYSLHGLALQATDLFEEMRRHDIKPDAITFLNVLSSCRHAGLLDQGRFYFNSMEEYGVEQDLDHYSCLVDLLGRAGLLEEARDMILKMPMQPNAVIWGTLLSCCRLHGNVWIGIEAAKNILLVEPECSATHVQLANMYAKVGQWDEVARVRKNMKDRVLKTSPGFSWIEIGNDVNRFKADDSSNPKMSEVLCILEILMDHLTISDHVAEPSQEILDNM